MPRTQHPSLRRCSDDQVSQGHWPEGATSPFTSHGQAMPHTRIASNTISPLIAREVKLRQKIGDELDIQIKHGAIIQTPVTRPAAL